MLGYYTGLFCLSGKCQGVIDIFLTVPFIFVPCFRFYDLGSHWPLPVHSFLSIFFFGGGASLKIAQSDFNGVSFIWDNLLFPFLRAAPLTVAIYFEIQLFSMLFDLRFTPNALSTEVWKSHPVPQQRRRRCADATVLGCSSVPNVVLSLQTKLKLFSVLHGSVPQYNCRGAKHENILAQTQSKRTSNDFAPFCYGNDLVWHHSCCFHLDMPF